MKHRFVFVLFIMVSLLFFSCTPRQEDVDEAMEMILSICYSGTLAATYNIELKGFTLTNDGYDIQIVLEDMDIIAFYKEMAWTDLPPYKTISGTVHFTPSNIFGEVELTSGPIDVINFDKTREPKIIADGVEFSSMSSDSL